MKEKLCTKCDCAKVGIRISDDEHVCQCSCHSEKNFIISYTKNDAPIGEGEDVEKNDYNGKISYGKPAADFFTGNPLPVEKNDAPEKTLKVDAIMEHLKNFPAPDWKEGRQNLLAMLEKFPNMALNVIDSAYLAGLEEWENINKQYLSREEAYQKGYEEGQSSLGHLYSEARVEAEKAESFKAGIAACVKEVEKMKAELNTETDWHECLSDLLTRIKAL